MKKLFLLLPLLSGCVIPIIAPVPQSTFANPLLANQWQITEANGERIENTSATLLLRKDRYFSAETDCNNLMGSYSLSGNYELNFAMPASTRMSCRDMRNEVLISAALPKVNSYRLIGTGIEMLDKNRQPVLRAIPKK